MIFTMADTRKRLNAITETIWAPLSRLLALGGLRLSRLSSHRTLVAEHEALKASYAALQAAHASHAELAVKSEVLRASIVDLAAKADEKARLIGEDFNLIEDIFRSLSTPELAMLVEAKTTLSDRVFLVGEDQRATWVERVLRHMGRQVERISDPSDCPARGGDVIVAAPPFTPEWYGVVASLRERVHGSVYTTFQLFSAACLYRLVEGVLGYHVQPNAELLPLLTGQRILAPLARLNERFPLKGKRVLEHGPLDGAITGNLVTLGVGSLTCVEVRLVNVLKILAAKYYLGWKNVDVIVDDMHTADGRTYGRYDLVVAHSVYYHSMAPFHFLKTIATLADTLYIGGLCANPERLKAPLATLEYEGYSYRAQPFSEHREDDGAGIHRSGYYFVPDDLIAFLERLGYAVEVLDVEHMPPHKYVDLYLRVLARKRSPGR